MLEWLIENNVVCHALEAMIFASIACSILGVIISRMNLSSIGFTMSHAAFAGAAIGMFLGVNAQMAAIAFSMAVAALIGPVSDKAKMAADATLGVLFAMSMAVAIFLISYMEYMGKGLSASSPALWRRHLALQGGDLRPGCGLLPYHHLRSGILQGDLSHHVQHEDRRGCRGSRQARLLYPIIHHRPLRGAQPQHRGRSA